MCEKSRQGMVGAPWEGRLTTGIEECQRSGVFVNSTDGALIVRTGGVRYSVPRGKSATVPVGQDLQLSAEGRGAVSWAVTSAVLPAQLVEAPGVEAPAPAEAQVLMVPGDVPIELSSGNYSKLVFIGVPAEGGIM